MMPQVTYYARLEYCTKAGKKTPKYKVVGAAGYYPPMEALKDKNGDIIMYLLEKLKDDANVPAMRLQAKDSLNFTGMKDLFENGRMSGFAYGYPFGDETYSEKKRTNPFYTYRDDGFLFIIHQSERPAPEVIELIVLEGARVLIASYCKQLRMGGFDDVLEKLRKQAYQNMLL